MSNCNSKKPKTKTQKEEAFMIKRIKMYVHIFLGKPSQIKIFRYEEGYLARITIKMSHLHIKKRRYYMHHYICFNEYSDIRDFYTLCNQDLLKKIHSLYETNSITNSKIKFLNSITHDYFKTFKKEKPRQHFILFPCALKKIQHYVFEEPQYVDTIGIDVIGKSCFI